MHKIRIRIHWFLVIFLVNFCAYCIEVLDEIQDELIGSDFMPIEKDEEVVLTCGSARIYEMPEE